MNAFFEHENSDQTDTFDTDFSWKSSLLWMKQSFYEGLYQLFNFSPTTRHRAKHQRLYFYLVNAYTGLQLISLLEVGEHAAHWSDYQLLWDFLLYFRIDQQCAQLGLINECIILSQTTIITLLLLFLLACALAGQHKNIPNVLKYLITIGFYLMLRILFIPNLILTEIAVFRTVFTDEQLSSIDISTVNTSAVGIPFAAFTVLCICVAKYAHIIGSAELRHSQQTLDITARAHSNVEILALKIRLATVTFYVLNGSFHPNYFLALVFFTEAYVFFQYFWQLPYYNHPANKTKLAVSISTSFCAFGFLYGKAFDNSGITVYLILIVTPMLIVLTVTKFFDQRVGLIGRVTLATLHSCDSHLDLERKLRAKLVEPPRDDPLEVIKLLSGYFKSALMRKKALLVVWESNYCLYALNDERLARIKLSKSLLTSLDFESSFQIFICNKNLDASDAEIFEDSEFLQFKLKLEKTKHEDLSICYIFYQIIEELEQPQVNISKISSLFKKFNKTNKEVTSAYEELSTKYGGGLEVSALYSSYALQILKDTFLAERVQQRNAAAKNNSLHYNRNLSYFDDQNGLMIVSGEFDALGKIIFANEKLSEILGESQSDLIENHLSNFVPYPYNFNHNKNLERYLLTCTDTTINVPSSTFISNQLGYLIEVKLKIQCIAVGSYAFFLVLMKKKDVERGVLLVDHQWNIVGQSENSTVALKPTLHSLIGLNIQHFIPGVDLESLVNTQEIQVSAKTRLVYREKKNVTQWMRYFHVYSEEITSRGHSMTPSSPNHSKSLKFLEVTTEGIKSAREQTGIGNSLGASTTEEITRLIQVRRLKPMLRKLIKRLSISVATLLFIFVALAALLIVYLVYMNQLSFLYDTLEWSHGIIDAFNDLTNSARMYKLVEGDPSRQSEILAKTSKFLKVLGEYRDLESDILDNFDDTELTDLVLKDIYYWESTFVAKSAPCSNIIDQFILEGGKLESSNSTEFILLNGLGNPNQHLRQITKTIARVAYAEKDKLEGQFSLILLGSFGIIIISLALLAQFIISLRKYTASHWRHLLTEFQAHNVQMKADIFKRLDLVHDKVPEPLSKNAHVGPAKVPMSLFRYFWRVLVVIGSTCGYLLLLYYMFAFHEIQPMRERLGYYHGLLEYKYQLTNLEFWTRESMLWHTEQTLLNNFPVLYPFEESDAQFDEVTASLEGIQTALLDFSGSSITNDETNALFGEFIGTEFGLVPALRASINEAQYYKARYQSVEAFVKFYDQIEVLKESLNVFNTKFEDETMAILSENEKNLFMLNIFGAFFNFLLVLVLFYLFIKQEKSMLDWKSELYDIVTKHKTKDEALDL